MDLTELARRENEQVEWKRGVADLNNVVRTLVAFSNDLANLGGGYVVCGAEEDKDDEGFPLLVRSGLTPSRLKEIENKVLAICRNNVEPSIAPLVQELDSDDPGRRILVFIAPATGHAHQLREAARTSGVFWIRVSRSTVVARNGLLRELLVRKGALARWDERAVSKATPEAIDGLVLRERLTEMGLWDDARGFDDVVSAERTLGSFVPPICVARPLTQDLLIRNFAALLFAREVQRWVPGSTSKFSIYPGTDRSERHVERVEIVGDIVHQAKRLLELLDAASVEVLDKEDDKPNLRKYPTRALHEALVNAIVHRDYEVGRPVRVTVFTDRIEIESPGGLVRGVDPDRFRQGGASPWWRNQCLAWFFSKLQLAQAEGQGIPTILRTMREMGSPAPTFELGPNTVVCVLPAHPRHAAMLRVAEAERLVVQGSLEEAEERLLALLEQDAYQSQALTLLFDLFRMQDRPERVASFLRDFDIVTGQLSLAAKLTAGEVLARASGPLNVSLARELLADAGQGRLEEHEARRIARGFQRLGDYKKALATLDRAVQHNPSIAEQPLLQRVVGDLHLDLAKNCIATARARTTPTRLKTAAWDQAERHLSRAEHALGIALSGSWGSRRDAIEEALKFSRMLRKQATRPPTGRRKKRPRSPRSEDAAGDDLDRHLIVED